MTHVRVVILHRDAGRDDRHLGRALIEARADLAIRHRAAFQQAGADDVRIVARAPDDRPFGERLLAASAGLPTGAGLVALGSGAGPLLTQRDRGRLVAAASGQKPAATVNNRYSADLIALARAHEALDALGAAGDLRDVRTDNVLPRRLVAAGVPVTSLGGRAAWRHDVDIDGPLDLVLLGGSWARHLALSDRDLVQARFAAVRACAADPRRELLVAGRTSAGTLAWLERQTASRTRSVVEERGLRTSIDDQRPPASLIGLLLDREGPDRLGALLARLADAALIDTRVLLAHRLGPDERGWPEAEDRYAADLLLADRISDPWLRDLATAAREAPIPIVLGAHTLVGPGLRLALGVRR